MCISSITAVGARFLYEAVSYVPYKLTTVCYAETNERIYAWSMGLVELFSLFRERVYVLGSGSVIICVIYNHVN